MTICLPFRGGDFPLNYYQLSIDTLIHWINWFCLSTSVLSFACKNQPRRHTERANKTGIVSATSNIHQGIKPFQWCFSSSSARSAVRVRGAVRVTTAPCGAATKVETVEATSHTASGSSALGKLKGEAKKQRKNKNVKLPYICLNDLFKMSNMSNQLHIHAFLKCPYTLLQILNVSCSLFVAAIFVMNVFGLKAWDWQHLWKTLSLCPYAILTVFWGHLGFPFKLFFLQNLGRYSKFHNRTLKGPGWWFP